MKTKQNNHFTKLRKFTLAVITMSWIFGICTVEGAVAATFTMPTNCASLQACFANMSSGDTLIIKDGTYTGAANMISNANKPPSGSEGAYTVVRAENDGNVFFDGQSARETFTVYGNGTAAMQYVTFIGLVWKNSTSNTMISYGDNHHLKFIRCGAGEGGAGAYSFGAHGQNNTYFPRYILFEECYAWGASRYKFIAYQASYVIFRRCVARFDYVNTGEPSGGFSIYNSNNILVQNSIAIDGNTRTLWGNSTTDNAAFYAPNNTSPSTNVTVVGSIALNWDMPFAGTRGDTVATVNFNNCVGWATTSGDSLSRGLLIAYDQGTFGNFTTPSTPSFNGYGGTQSITTSIFYGISTNVIDQFETVSYNSFYNNPTYSGGSNPIKTVNPLAASLLYLPRIESSSPLATAGSGGKTVGATILKKIGASGTLWGETGYNTVTTENLWPFPHEDKIKANMSTYNLHGVNGARGFCATGKQLDGINNITLTSYIWEYLGNKMPTDIYGNAGIITAPAPGGLNIKIN